MTSHRARHTRRALTRSATHRAHTHLRAQHAFKNEFLFYEFTTAERVSTDMQWVRLADEVAALRVELATAARGQRELWCAHTRPPSARRSL